MNMKKRGSESYGWQFELCECGKHGRFISADRAEYSLEFADRTTAAALIELMQGGMTSPDMVNLTNGVVEASFPQSEDQVPQDLLVLIDNWNRAYNASFKPPRTSFFDPRHFHKVAPGVVPEKSGQH